jgi:hypothetical protein
MIHVVEQFESLGYVGHVDTQPEMFGALSERPGCAAPLQADSDEFVHRLAQADVPLATELLGGGGDIIIKPDGRPHEPSIHQ